MSRLLLDAHVVIWWDNGSRALGPKAKSAIESASAVYVSAASEWELSIKASIGKIRLRRCILDAVLDAGFEPLPVTFAHTQAVRTLPPLHKDPFDRLLVAVAQTEGLTLVSVDSILKRYDILFQDASK